jgi:hypothetical protein
VLEDHLEKGPAEICSAVANRIEKSIERLMRFASALGHPERIDSRAVHPESPRPRRPRRRDEPGALPFPYQKS